MATPHLAAEPGDVAPLVLMPGDPRRARRIADDLLDDVRLVTGMEAATRYAVGETGDGVARLALAAGLS